MTADTQYDVEFVTPDDQLVVAGTETELDVAAVDVLAAETEDGRWMAWVPYHEPPTGDRDDPRRAIASNKYVAGGAIADHYWGDST